MESAAAISELNWNFDDGSTFSDQHQFATLMSAEEAEIMAQLFSGYQYTKEQSVAQGCDSFLRLNSSCSDQETMNMVMDGDSYYYFSENSLSNLHYRSQGNQLIPVSDFETIPGSGAVKDGVPFSMSTDFYMGDDGNACLEFHGVPNNNPVEEAVCQNETMSSDESREVHAILEQRLQCKRKMQLQENSQLEIAPIKRRKQDDLTNSNLEKAEPDYPYENPQKITKLSGDGQRIRKNSQLKKNQKLTKTDEAEENMRLNGQSSSSYCSEDDSLSSQEHNGITSSCNKGSSPALNLNGKARTGRGSATDPQSLYARKRRERINERLRILQNLVPNGTKVDISTMLEEAVHYVKFLQLQIKLLSSDDMWMYAPIACNGMDIGLDLKISPPS